MMFRTILFEQGKSICGVQYETARRLKETEERMQNNRGVGPATFHKLVLCCYVTKTILFFSFGNTVENLHEINHITGKMADLLISQDY